MKVRPAPHESGHRFSLLARRRAYMLLESFWSRNSPGVCLSAWSLGTFFVHGHTGFKHFWLFLEPDMCFIVV